MQTTEAWPNLFIPGAGKSGTTSLHNYLNQHPDIWMTIEKEPVFFNRVERYENLKSRRYYLSLFAKGKDKRYRGESSTAYMCSATAIQRIKETVNNPKFIFILRNPIDRAFSHYNWLKGSGFENRPFKEAFINSFKEFENGSMNHPSYYSEGLYNRWIRNYLNEFGKESIHLILSESLKLDALCTLNSCFTFLGLSPLSYIDSRHANESVMMKTPAFYKKMLILMSEEGDSFYKEYYRKIFPEKARIYIRRQMINGLTYFKNYVASHGSTPAFDQSLRVWVKDFYNEDVRELRNMTNIDTFLWEEFALD